MPRKKRHRKQAAVAGPGAPAKHAKHAKNAEAGPAAKGSKKVDKEETRSQNLQQLQEMFEGKLDAVLVHMIMEDCNYNVETALETLFKLAGDVPTLDGSNMNPQTEKPRELVSYSRSETDESEDSNDIPNVLYPRRHVPSSGTVAGSGTDVKFPFSSKNGVGLDDISLPYRIEGLDYAIKMTQELDRNSFSEESIEKVTAGLVAYQDTGDRNKIKELGNLSAIAEMVLEAGVKEEKKEEKERVESSKVKFKSPHSRLPVYNATDDRLVGGMSSSSGSSASSSPSPSDDETNQPDGLCPAADGKSKEESKGAGNETGEPKDAGPTALSKRTPLTEFNEKSQENLSLNNGDTERRLPSARPISSNTTKNCTPGSTIENRNEETVSVRPKATVTFWNNLTTAQAELDDISDEDSEKDFDKHISFQEDSESYRGDRLERDNDQSIASSERSNLLKSQQLTRANSSTEKSNVVYPSGREQLDNPFSVERPLRQPDERSLANKVGPGGMSVPQMQLTKANNCTDRSNIVYPPVREQLGNPYSVERPLRQPDERSFVNEVGQGGMNMPQMQSARSQQRPAVKPQGTVQLENNQFFSQYSPLNVGAATSPHRKNEHRPFQYDANFVPGFGLNATHFLVKNITPGLLPRTYCKDSQPPKKSTQPWPNQGYSRAFFAEIPPGTGTKTSQYPHHAHFSNVFRFQGPHLRSPTIPRSNVTITELPESPEEPITATNMQEVSSGPPKWPLIQHTNLKRNEYPAPSPREIPPLPPGKVLCLMRGCPGSGKSTLAMRLKGDGVILSTDDFYMVNGQYEFDFKLVGEAHDWNHKRAEECLKKGTTPIIIDNTNIMTWEMKPYVAMALKHQYQVVFREADAPWKNKAGELAKRNSHGVPKVAIVRMLQNYEPNATVESIMNGPDKKKTPEYVAKLNQEGPDHPEEDGSPPRMSGHQGDQAREGKIHQDSALGDDSGMDAGWETVKHKGGHDGGRQNGHGRGNHWNQQRGGRKDLNQRNNLKGGSPSRYNNEHPANRYQTEGMEDCTRAEGRKKYGPHNSPNRTQSPSHSNRRSPKDRGGMRRDGPRHDDEGRISSPKKGRKIRGSHSPSPNQGYENNRNPHAAGSGKQNHGQNFAPKSLHNKPADATIRFLESDESLSQDPMKKLMNDIGLSSSKLASSSGKERTSGEIDQNSEMLKNSKPRENRASPVRSRQSQSQSSMPQMRQDLIQEVAFEQANASDTETLMKNSHLSGSDDQKGSSSTSSASLQQDPALGCDEKTYRMLLAENLQGNFDLSLDIEGKIDMSVDVTERSKEDVSLHSADNGKNINLTGDAMQCEDKKTACDNPIKEMDTEQSTTLKRNFTTNCSEAQNSKSIQGKTVEGVDLPFPEKAEDQFECAPKTKSKALSPQMNEEEGRSPSQCQSRESSRAPTPSLRRTSRRPSGGKSSRRLAAVFTSPTSLAPTGSEDTDWSKYDPSRNIPKPTFPVSNAEAAPIKVEQCDKSTETSGHEFSFLQRIVGGTMEPGDLPAGYVCRTAVAISLRKADNSNDDETGEEGDRDGSSPIPVSVKLHKGCMTEEIIEETNLEEEKISMMQLCFPTSSAKDLKSLLETCSGDVQMATNVLLDSLDQLGVSPGRDISAPKEKVLASDNPVSGNEVLGTKEVPTGNNYGIGDAQQETGEISIRNMDKPMGSHSANKLQHSEDVRTITNVDRQATVEPGGGSPDNFPTSKRLDSDNVPTDALEQQSTSRLDAMNKLASDSERFASELEQANQIIFSNGLKAHTEQTPERAQPGTGDATLETHDTGKATMAVEMNGSMKSDPQGSKDSEFNRQEAQTEQREQEEDTDSGEFEEFSNNFYSGASKLVKSKSASCSTAGTSDDELPPLESFMEDRQMLQLAAACGNVDVAVHGQIVENTFVPLHQPSDSLPVTKDKSAPEPIREETINPVQQTKDSATPETNPDLPVTTKAKEGEVTLQTDQSTPLPEHASQRVDKEESKDIKDLPEFRKEDDKSGTSWSGPNNTINDMHDNQKMDKHGGLSGGQDPKENDQEIGTSSPKLQQGTKRPEGDDADNLVRDAPDLEGPSGDEFSDSDIPWKSGYDVIEPEADGEAATVDPSDKFTDSGEGVYDYLGGMVLQMDAAFALQLQELFGQVGFHLDPDMLSPDDLKVKIGYQVAKQLHAAWSKGLDQRFQDQERQVEEMLQRDEELARKLQQEENLKKLAKSHRDKKPAKFVAPGSPKWNKKRQKEPEPGGVVTDGGQDVMRAEQLLVGGGLRKLGELGAMGGAESRMNPPPVQRGEVPELAQIMAEEELRQEREKKGMWSSPSPVRANTIATKMKRDQLFEAFPDVDKKALDDIFQANGYDLQSTMWEVNAVYRESTSPVKEVFSPEALMEMEKRRDMSPARTKKKGQTDGTDGQFQSTEQPDYDDYRAEATLHFKQRDECFKKAAKAYHSGQKELALYYSNQGRLHSVRLKEANRRAAELILVQRKHETGENKLDLHNLHVEEALQALQEVLIERSQLARRGTPSQGQQRYLEVVTGRGRHSQGGVAKLKPAVCKFLEQRGYRYTIPNAGCLRVYLS